jgi:hypothetical protein
VRAAVVDGAGTFEAIARRTGLDVDLVRLAVDQLLGLGLLTSDRLQVGCPDGGCGSCPSSGAGTSCGAGGSTSRGLVLLTIGRTRGA